MRLKLQQVSNCSGEISYVQSLMTGQRSSVQLHIFKLQISLPKCSMVLVYLATELGDLWGKCWYIHIPAPWSIWIYLGWFPNPIAIISIHFW